MTDPRDESFRRLRSGRVDLDALDLYARITTSDAGKAPVADATRIHDALATVGSALANATTRTSTLHGWRTQALFEAMVASLGKVRLLKFEDVGDVFFSGPKIQPPDFRIVSEDGTQFLVEVKNHHSRNPESIYKMRQPDYEALLRYGELVGVPDVKVAIYWAAWNFWSLLRLDSLNDDGAGHLVTTFHEAMKTSEMHLLGDRMPATEFPLAMTVVADTTKPRRSVPDPTDPDIARVEFTIGDIVFTAGDAIVTVPQEIDMMWRLMLYGGWEEDLSMEFDGEDLVSQRFEFAPVAPEPGQPFAFHRPVSSIYSTMFNQATTADAGEITELRVDINPSALGNLVPDEYQGEGLKLWQIELVPNYEVAGTDVDDVE